MGVFIDYSFKIRCSEQELLERMGRLREKLMRLPFESVSEVFSVDPAYQSLPLNMLRKSGYVFPQAVSERLEGKLGGKHDELCHLAAPCAMMCVPKKLEWQFLKPAVDFSEKTTLWRNEDLPEKVGDPPFRTITFFRMAFAIELASVMLRHGHLIIVQPGEGCETFPIGLTSFRTKRTPVWLGSGFSKTQYATHFIEAHESICKGLDFAAEEGLLFKANDTCGFFGHRDWSASAEIVNQETTFAYAVRGLLTAGIAEARKAGVLIEDCSSPATKNYNLVKVTGKGKSRKKPE